MTLMQRRLVNNTVKAIQKNRPFTQREIGIQSGYSKVSRNIYKRTTKKYIMEKLKRLGYSEEEMKERFNLAAELTLKEKDFTNFLRANEDIARMQGMFTDRTENKTEIKVEEQRKLIRDSLQELLYPPTTN